MKYPCFILTVLSFTATVHAEGKASTDTKENPCGPCCVPKVKQCIDCECYSPAHYDLQCDWGLFLYADFLYWYGKESDLPYAVRVRSISSGGVFNSVYVGFDESLSFNASWDPGFRVGIGWNTPCDGWGVEANWTYYCTKLSKTKRVSDFEGFSPNVGEQAFFNPWNTPIFNVSNGIYNTRAKGKWEFRINTIDVEISRQYWTSPYFTIRPIGGVRGSWTKTRFEATSPFRSYNPLGVILGQLESKNHFTNTFCGAGLFAGVEPTWFWTRCLALYGGGDIALLWGKHEMRKEENVFLAFGGTSTNDFTFRSKKSESDFLQPILDVKLGLRYENTFCCDRYRCTINAGWEHHFWFDLNQRYIGYERGDPLISLTASTAGSIAYDETQHDVSFGGFVLRARFDF